MESSAALQANHRRYKERLCLLQQYGYDLKNEYRFILEKIMPLTGAILEVGTGKGYFTIELARSGRRFTSLDVSPVEQEFARLNIRYLGLEDFVDFHIADAGRLPYSQDSYDIIISVSTVHHLADPFRVLDEMARVAAPGGRILLSDFTPEGQDVINQIHLFEGKPAHKMGEFGLRDLKRYFEDKKYRVDEHQGKHQEMIVIHKP